MKFPFTDHELNVLLIVAQVAITDADTFDAVASKLDMADDEMVDLRDRLIAYMDSNGEPIVRQRDALLVALKDLFATASNFIHPQQTQCHLEDIPVWERARDTIALCEKEGA